MAHPVAVLPRQAPESPRCDWPSLPHPHLGVHNQPLERLLAWDLVECWQRISLATSASHRSRPKKRKACRPQMCAPRGPETNSDERTTPRWSMEANRTNRSGAFARDGFARMASSSAVGEMPLPTATGFDPDAKKRHQCSERLRDPAATAA